MDQEIMAGAKVRRIPISEAVPGMILARDVYSRNDQLIIGSGEKLDSTTIAKIMFYSVERIAVYQWDQTAEGTGDSFSAQLKGSKEFKEFEKNYDETLDDVRGILFRMAEGSAGEDEDKLIDQVTGIVDGCDGRTRSFQMLNCIRDYDEPTYVHSLNVSIICSIFADWMNLDSEEKKTLVLSGLLHDIGKTTISKEIISKPGRLTLQEHNIIKTHAIRGYEILKMKNIDERVKLSAVQHHERYDGSGYPFGKTGESIDSFSMIVAIADVYDAMTSDRTYRQRLCPFDVIKNLEFEERNRYNPKYLIPLLSEIANTYIHQTVRLSNDAKGEVILMNKNELSKPIVKVDNGFIDLSKRRELRIVEVM